MLVQLTTGRYKTKKLDCNETNYVTTRICLNNYQMLWSRMQ